MNPESRATHRSDSSPSPTGSRRWRGPHGGRLLWGGSARGISAFTRVFDALWRAGVGVIGRMPSALSKLYRPTILSPMLRIETEREDDGRWLAEVPGLPGVLGYGATDVEARAKVTALALRVIAERVENGEALPAELGGMFQLA